jgi:lipopolysaccharide transport system permease protein
MIQLLRGTWRFRGFIVASVKREFASRYLGTQLGAIWTILHPLALIAIYTVVFAQLMQPRLPGHASRFAYSIYLTSGFIVWALFSDLLLRSVGIFVHNANLLKKVNVHKLAFPVIASISALINAGLLGACFIAFLLATGNLPGWPVLAAIPVLAITCLFAMGLGLFLSTINVFYRDVEQGTQIVLQFWFWATPIVYAASALPGVVQRAMVLNPLWPIVHAMQTIFLESRWPDWMSLLYPLAVSLVLVLAARTAFERLGTELVDEL